MTDVSGFRGQRPDGVHFHIVDSGTRGDTCFSGRRKGWYFYYYTPKWAIDTRTVTGPFRSVRNARKALLDDRRHFTDLNRG